MKPTKEELISIIGISLIVMITIVLYVKYYDSLKTIGEIIVYSSPILFFCLVGSFVVNRDRKRIRKAKDIKESTKTIEVHWITALKHDLLTYLVPIAILLIPVLLGSDPGLVNVIQAIIAYLTLIYLKFVYWGEI